MRTLLIVLIGIPVFAISCGRKVTCQDPVFSVSVYCRDTIVKKRPYQIKTYQLGSGYTILIDSFADTVRYFTTEYNSYITIHADTTFSLKDDVDYLFYFPVTNTSCKIQDINRTELKGVRHPFGGMSGGSCSVTKCFNFLSYTINGEHKTVGGSKGCYDLSVSVRQSL